MNEQAAARPPDWYIPAGDACEFWTAERCYITELLNDSKSPDVSLAVARIEPGVRTQLHSLTGIEEIYIVQTGRGVIEIDGVEQAVTAGDRAIVPAGAAQRVRNTGSSDLRCYCLCRPRFRPDCYIDLESVSG